MSISKKITIPLLVLIFIVAAYFRIDFLRSVDHYVPHDSVNYDKMVRQMLETGVYGYDSTTANARVTPGYPLFMAAVYKAADYTKRDPFPYIRYVQMALSLAILWMIYRLARRFAGEIAGLLAAALSAIYPSFIWANGAILTEVLATFFLLAYAMAQVKTLATGSRLHAFCSGLLLGLTVLVRPEFLPIFVPVYLFFWLWKKDRRDLRLPLLTGLGAVVCLLPWWLFNAATLHEFVFTATQTNPFTAGTYPFNNYNDGLVDRHGKTQNEIAIERLKVGFTQHTLLFVWWYTLGKLQYLYTHMYFGAGHKPMYNVLPHKGAYHLAILYSGLLGMIASLRKWRSEATVIIVITLTMSCIRLLFVPEFRYNFTVMPFIIVLSAIFIDKCLLWIRMALNGRTAERAGGMLK